MDKKEQQKACFHMLDTLFDIKTLNEAKRRLRDIPDEIDQLREDYEDIHRILREHSFKMDEFVPII